MCNFFSFISDGRGNVKYFTLEQRKKFLKHNPKQYEMDSHSSIAEFYYGSTTADDNYNKYEFNDEKLIINQINVEDDSKQVEKWINKFIETDEYKNLCEITVEHNGNALQFVPEYLKDYNLCEKAVINNGNALQYVPIHLRDYKICKKAVNSNGDVLQYVPKQIIDYNLCELAVTNYGMALQYVPKQIIDYNLCEKAVINNGYSLKYVPEQIIDYNLCKMAVINKDYSLIFVPKHLKKLFNQ